MDEQLTLINNIDNPLNKRPLVSIVVPSYNQSQFIEETILSILQQTYRPLEIIIMDGGSTDGTLDILRKFDDVKEVKWVSELDRGHADGVNKGFTCAKGEIIGWLNSDDVYFSKDAVEYMVREFEDSPDVDIIYGEEILISKESVLLRFFLMPPYDRSRLERRDLISQPATFLRQSVVKAELLDVNQIGLDHEYWLRLGRKGYNFLHVRKLIAGDRQYPGRISNLHKEKIIIQILDAKKRLGIPLTYSYLSYFIDRLSQAICRLRGIFFAFSLILNKNLPNELAFNGKIDSPWKLLFRQIFCSVTDVY